MSVVYTNFLRDCIDEDLNKNAFLLKMIERSLLNSAMN